MKLTRENGAFISEVYDQVLITGECGVGGHFRFQQNGSSCLMCQREQRASLAMRRACVNAIQNLQPYDQLTDQARDGAARLKQSAIAALEAIEVKGDSTHEPSPQQ